MRLLFLGVAIYAAFHYEENKPVVAIVVAIFIFMILLSGLEYINIYDDRFELVNSSVIPYFTKRQIFYYSDLKEVQYDGAATVFTDIIAQRAWNKLFVTLKSEEVKNLSTYMFLGQLKEATGQINRLIKSKK